MAESQLHALPNAVPHELPSPNRPRSSTNGDPPAVPTNTPLLQPQHSFASATTVESDSEQFALTGHWHGKHPTPTDSMTASLQNCVFIKNLALSTVVGPDAWGNHGKPQPILISCRVHREIGPAGENDQVDDTLSYSQIVKDIKEVVSDYQRDRGGFTSARNLSETIFLKSYRRWGAYAVCITIHLPKANLRAEGGFILTSMYHEKLTDRLEESIVSNFRIPCIIGVNPHERLAKQIVVVSFKIIEEKDIPGTSGSPGTVAHWAGLSKEVVQVSHILGIFCDLIFSSPTDVNIEI